MIPNYNIIMRIVLIHIYIIFKKTFIKQYTDSYCCQNVSSMNSRKCTDNQLLLVCDERNLSNVSQNNNSRGNMGMSHTQPGISK